MEQWDGVLAVSVGTTPEGLAQLEPLEEKLAVLGPVSRCFLNESLARTSGVPTLEELLAGAARNGAAQVLVVPLLLLAGNHWQQVRDTVALWSGRFRSLGLAGPMVSRESHGRELAGILADAHGPVAPGERIFLLSHGTGVFPQGYDWIQAALPPDMVVLQAATPPPPEPGQGQIRLCPLLLTAGGHFRKASQTVARKLEEQGCEVSCSDVALAALPQVAALVLERCRHPLFPATDGTPGTIAMAGVDHTLAPVGIREQFSFTGDGTQALVAVMREPDVLGAVLLSTCNRTELWVSLREQAHPDLAALLCRLKGLEPEDYRPFLQQRQGQAAAEYLFRLAAGLNSRILGEDQILSQVRQALFSAQQAGTADPVLSALFRDAVSGAKLVKTRLTLSTARCSAAELGISALARRGCLRPGTRCLVIGNGEIGKRACRALLEQGAEVSVTIRQYHRGQVEVVPQCHPVPYTRRYQALAQCQVIVSATASPHVTITRQELLELGDPGFQQVFLDLAVPRDIQPDVRQLPWVTLYNIDDVSPGSVPGLEEQLRQARQILQEPLDRFLDWYRLRMLLPRMDRLLERLETQNPPDLPEEPGALRKRLFQIGQRQGSHALAHMLTHLEEVSVPCAQ